MAVSCQAFSRWKVLPRLFRPLTGRSYGGSLRRCLNTTVVLFQSDQQDLPDISVGNRNGFPVVSIPLPSRRELCEFTLRPLSETVKEWLANIKDEDGGIDRASIYNPDGSRVSGSTRLDVLLRSDFHLMVNDIRYTVRVPEDGKLSEEDSRVLAKTKTMIHQLYSSLNIEEHQLEKESKLLSKLDEFKFDLEPMEKLKNELDQQSAQRANLFVWSGLGFMALQFGFLARLTWWEYSWDIMEPVTYFVAYGTAMAAYAYFVITRQEYLYPDARDRQRLISFHKFTRRSRFDIGKYNNLKDCVAKIEEDLKEIRSPYKLHLPTRITEKIVDK